MGKGEIARYEQFLLFPQCFQKACLPGASKGVIVWEWVKWKSTNLLNFWKNFKMLCSGKRGLVIKRLDMESFQSKTCLSWQYVKV